MSFNLDPATLTYDQIIGAYRSLLIDQPGKALLLGGDLYAVMEGDLLCVTDCPDPVRGFDTKDFAEFDSNAWISSERRWDGDDSPEHTISFIENPTFFWVDSCRLSELERQALAAFVREHEAAFRASCRNTMGEDEIAFLIDKLVEAA